MPCTTDQGDPAEVDKRRNRPAGSMDPSEFVKLDPSYTSHMRLGATLHDQTQPETHSGHRANMAGLKA